MPVRGRLSPAHGVVARVRVAVGGVEGAEVAGVVAREAPPPEVDGGGHGGGEVEGQEDEGEQGEEQLHGVLAGKRHGAKCDAHLVLFRGVCSWNVTALRPGVRTRPDNSAQMVGLTEEEEEAFGPHTGMGIKGGRGRKKEGTGLAPAQSIRCIGRTGEGVAKRKRRRSAARIVGCSKYAFMPQSYLDRAHQHSPNN